MKAAQWRRSRIGPYLRHLPRLKHLRGTWLHRALGDRFFEGDMWTPQRERFAAGVALGMFLAMMPVPLQMFAAAFLAFLTRVNIPAAVVCTWISNPFTFAFFITIQYTLGSFALGKAGKAPPPLADGALDFLASAPMPILAGSVLLGMTLSILSYPLALLGWDLAERHLRNRLRHPRPSAPRMPAGAVPGTAIAGHAQPQRPIPCGTEAARKNLEKNR
jgi:hypothetical protein